MKVRRFNVRGSKEMWLKMDVFVFYVEDFKTYHRVISVCHALNVHKLVPDINIHRGREMFVKKKINSTFIAVDSFTQCKVEKSNS